MQKEPLKIGYDYVSVYRTAAAVSKMSVPNISFKEMVFSQCFLVSTHSI